MPYNKDIRGWMTEWELQKIELWAAEVPPSGHIVEIGSMLGRSAVCWAMSCHPTVTVTCVDRWDGIRANLSSIPKEICEQNGFPEENDTITLDAFTKNTASLNNIRPLQVSGIADLPLDITADLMFLDAGHCNPEDWEYIEFWRPRIRAGGWVAGHDFSPEFPDVVENVKRLEEIYSRNVETFPNTSLWRFQLPTSS